MARSKSKEATVLDHGAAAAKFDYGQVSPQDRKALQEHAHEIRERLVFTALAMIDIGERLVAARALVPHGAWLPWLVAETGMSESWSRDCIRVYERFHGRRQLVEERSVALPTTAFVRLAGAPEAAAEDVFDRVQEGEKLRVTDVEEVIREHRQRGKEARGKGPRARAYEESESSGRDALHALAERGRDELIEQIITSAMAVNQTLIDADEQLRSGKRVAAKDLYPLFRSARWLTDALEQLTQRHAVGTVGHKPTHQTHLQRQPLEDGPWSDAASFLRDISGSDAINATLKLGVPAFVKRGLDAFRRAL